MAYNILGINPGHNASIAIISDGELIFFIEEERITKSKKDGHPISALYKFMDRYDIKIDELVVGGTKDPHENPTLSWVSQNLYKVIIRKLHKHQMYNTNDTTPFKYTNTSDKHHLNHAQNTFYNSGFDKSIVLVVDGAGSSFYPPHFNNNKEVFECESVGIAEYPNKFTVKHRSVGYNDSESNTGSTTITKTYEAVSGYLGFHPSDGGKTMGLAPYGEQNNSLPPLFNNGKGNNDIMVARYPFTAELKHKEVPIYIEGFDPQNKFHLSQTHLSKIQADLAWQVQNETQNEIVKLIEKAIQKTKLDSICISGGYGLNCVANYYFKKKFPNIKFYFDPIANDAGISIGAALGRWYQYSNSTKKNPLKSLYLGFKYSNKEIKDTIQKYNDKFTQTKVTPKQVAKLISEKNIVCLFQGRSEAGPRALGNRSILYDPTDPNGKDFVNRVKKREWFRPFAGTVLLEKADEWFDMAGLEESPFMMYAMDVWSDKQETIKAITHVDGTCRIQTVTKEQNLHYHNLIQEFEKITGVPILFNTSFNLAGDPLVETIEDALETLLKSELRYLYLPELKMLLEKK